MPHRIAGHDMPVQVKHILERRPGVGGHPETLRAGVGGDSRRHKHKPTRQLGIGELGYRPNMVPRYDEHMEGSCGWLRVECDDIGVFVADCRRSFVSDDAAEHAALCHFAQRNFTRPSRSGGLSASPSSTRITNFFSQCGVG